MKKFNHKDFDIETEIETGNDDFIYGNYVDWDRFRAENEDNLLDYFDVSLPWGKKLTILEYADFIKQEVFTNTAISDNYNLTKLPVSKQGEDISKLYIQFPNRNDSDSDKLIFEIFNHFEVPSDQEYEYELPEDLQYWHTLLVDEYSENEYEYYKNYPVEFTTYKDAIYDIQSKVNGTSDTLTKKSLILSSLIISESLLKSIIVKKTPRETGISEFSQEIISSEISKKLRGSVETRNGLFKKLFNRNTPKQNWVNLRNSLSHDIESSFIKDKNIIFTNMKEDKEETYSIDNLFKNQIEFYKELQTIIDEYNVQTE
ncbi:hypothetical protein JTF06_09135 [Desemzia sp. RIT804]|uniref:hypothetical protein n=1 Tax=Desemzia sp. RIT 804 TaxID=2810209 RepID=UPI00194F8D3D|nr:hypothetical protein [Desemzia sp. RIT 804]MBM6615049.1 hypothetical protein [Desemzia sp. RIT 804]